MRKHGLYFLSAFLVWIALGAGAWGQAERPVLSRADLVRLKSLNRERVFTALGSFDDHGLAEDAFILKAGSLLDASRVPGLAAALAAGDAAKVLDAVDKACRKPQDPAGRPAVSSGQKGLADGALAHRFSFYGETYTLPREIDWDHNPGTAHWGHDLNRFSYLEPLEQTYLATGDTRYSRQAVGLILDWIAKSDFSKCFAGTPYVFGSYLNNAIQCIAWSHCVASLLPRDQVRPIELLRILKSLHDHLAYLEIVTNGHSGNWPTIGCHGMLECLGTFSVLRDTNRFAGSAARTLTLQILDQVTPDGVQDELTPHYHRVVVGNLLGVIRPLRALGRQLDPATMAILGKMVRYVQQTTMPDGSKMAAFNDSDPGSPGHIGRQLGEVGLRKLMSPAASLGPECFPCAGVAFLRQRQDRGDLYLAFDAGPYGRGHQHEDKLGFWLFAYGHSFLVDPGRHLYDHSERSYYDYLRSTAAHSTIRIDGQDQHSAGRRKTWIPRKPLDLGWHAAEDEVRARGSYDLGYGPKNEISVVHHREIVFVKNRFWVVFDAVEGSGEHLVESRFQFAPGELSVEGAAAHTGFKDANLLLRAVASAPYSNIHVERGQENPRGGWYSDSYGKIEPAPALSLAARTPLPLHTATLLFPYRGAKPPAVTLALDGASAVIHTAETGDVRVTCSLWH